MTINLFFDTNTTLDLLGERQPYYTDAAKIATLAEKGKVKIFISPISYYTAGYYISKFENLYIAIDKLKKFKSLCKIASINDKSIENASSSSFKDFEDALQYNCAINCHSDIIISRNISDFKGSYLPVMTADEFLKSLNIK